MDLKSRKKFVVYTMDMLIDEVDVTFTGGHGGPGLVSFGKKAHSGPDGGNGGKGGDIYLVAEQDITLLNEFSRKDNYSAEDGKPGGKNRRSGLNGNDMELKIPVGTAVIDKNTKETIVEMTVPGQKLLISTGGKGGRGNYEFRGPKNTTPKFAQPGLKGETREVKLILKLIADFGLIGLPNAGKSSLLNELTNAKAGTANYAFTTLYPNLGVINGKVIADIPGLIEGASAGRGLGISFLKHIEKVSEIFHCISAESSDPVKDYKTVRNELGLYSKDLLKIPEVVLLTKSDLADEKEIEAKRYKLTKVCKHIMIVSIHDFDSLEKLKSGL